MTSVARPAAAGGAGHVLERVAALPPGKRAELMERLRRRRLSGSLAGDWIVRYRSNQDASLRLFCFPYAGGGASVFRSWGEALSPAVDVCAVQLPGRESRIGEPAYRRIGPLTQALADAIEPHLDRPFAFFGHSMGALVAFELAKCLRGRSRPQPARLLLAAFRAPQLSNPNIKIYHLPDEVLKVVLRTDGASQLVLRNEELMQAMLPTLRADFELCDTYEYAPQAPLDCPISIFGGLEDVRVGISDLEGWRIHTSMTSSLSMLPGSHFFVHSAQQLLLAEIARILNIADQPEGGKEND